MFFIYYCLLWVIKRVRGCDCEVVHKMWHVEICGWYCVSSYSWLFSFTFSQSICPLRNPFTWAPLPTFNLPSIIRHGTYKWPRFENLVNYMVKCTIGTRFWVNLKYHQTHEGRVLHLYGEFLLLAYLSYN